MSEKARCKWAESDPLLRAYHDAEWGVPEFESGHLDWIGQPESLSKCIPLGQRPLR